MLNSAWLTFKSKTNINSNNSIHCYRWIIFKTNSIFFRESNWMLIAISMQAHLHRLTQNCRKILNYNYKTIYYNIIPKRKQRVIKVKIAFLRIKSPIRKNRRFWVLFHNHNGTWHFSLTSMISSLRFWNSTSAVTIGSIKLNWI